MSKNSMARKRKSFTDINAGINVKELEELLLVVIPKYSTDPTLIQMTQDYRGSFSTAHQHYGIPESELTPILTILTTFITTSSSSLPSDIVANVYTYIGLIREKQQRHESAIEAFSTALWIQTSDKRCLPICVALTQHRLGQAYGKKGNHRQATALLQRALDGYEEAHVVERRPIVVHARKALEKFQRHQR